MYLNIFKCTSCKLNNNRNFIHIELNTGGSNAFKTFPNIFRKSQVGVSF